MTTRARGTSDGWDRVERHLDTLSDIAAQLRSESWSPPARSEPDIWLEPTPTPIRVEPSGDTVGAMIAAFLDDAQRGEVLDSGGGRYAGESLRELRSSLTHVDSELGSLRIREVDSDQVDWLLDELGRQGMPGARVDSVVVALRALRLYAADHGLTGRDAFPDSTLLGGGRAPRAERPAYAEPHGYAERPAFTEPPAVTAPPPDDDPAPKSSPTVELLATARRVATWTVRTVLFMFAVVVVLLILEL